MMLPGPLVRLLMLDDLPGRVARSALRAIAAWLLGASLTGAVAGEAPRHGLAMHGEPALPAGFSRFPYADLRAIRRGRVVLGVQGTFDSLNPLIVKGVAPDIVPRHVLQSLMTRSLDEPFTLYGLVAQSVEAPEDRSAVAFNLDPRARFSDGRRVTAEDIRFSFELLRRNGRPFHRASFGQVKAVEVENDQRIRFDLSGTEDRELPLLIALMPIFPAHATDAERFAETSLVPPVGSGPYRVSEVKPGERITLKRRTDYWAENLPVGRGLNNFDEIRYDFYRDANSLFEAFKAGLYDLRIENDPGRWRTGYDVPAVRQGLVTLESLRVATPKGMNGFVFNTRRALFGDVRVREALGLLFDFEWIDRNFYFGLLRRCVSYFGESDLSAQGRAADERERALLAPFPGTVRNDILAGTWSPAVSDGSGRDRDLARRALTLLREAGWILDGGTLRRRATGKPFSFEILVLNRQQERLALNYAQSLRRVGVSARVRQVDDVQFWRRLAAFDFEMTPWTWPVSPSPGNEQRNRWGSEAADRGGSLNYAGARSPAIDATIDATLRARTREDFVAAVRALDRVLLSGFYVVPLFYHPDLWLAYRRPLRRPDRIPLFGPAIELWWRESS